MAKKPETVFKDRIMPIIDTLPRVYARKVSQRSIRGTPDVWLCVNSNFVVLELKKDQHEKPDPLQEYEMNCARKAGGLALICYPENFHVVFEILEKIAWGKLGAQDFSTINQRGEFI